MFEICKTLINTGKYDRQNLMLDLGTLLMVGLLTRNELVELKAMLPSEPPADDMPTEETPPAA